MIVLAYDRDISIIQRTGVTVNIKNENDKNVNLKLASHYK